MYTFFKWYFLNQQEIQIWTQTTGPQNNMNHTTYTKGGEKKELYIFKMEVIKKYNANLYNF